MLAREAAGEADQKLKPLRPQSRREFFKLTEAGAKEGGKQRMFICKK